MTGILRDVEWKTTPIGDGIVYTPIGLIDGANGVHRAAIGSPELIRAIGLKIGSAVVVVRHGDSLRIEGLDCEVSVNESAGQTEIAIPDICAVCGKPLIDAGDRLYCPNSCYHIPGKEAKTA